MADGPSAKGGRTVFAGVMREASSSRMARGSINQIARETSIVEMPLIGRSASQASGMRLTHFTDAVPPPMPAITSESRDTDGESTEASSVDESPASPPTQQSLFGRWLRCECFRKKHSAFGARDISFLGGVCLMANNILGSAMVQLPALFQQAGWLIPTLTFAFIALWTTMAALYLARTLASFPGNSDFSQRWEMGRAARVLFPRWAYISTVLLLCLSFVAMNISNIIIAGQVTDAILLAAAQKTCALTLYPQTGGSPFTCISHDSDNIVTDSPFGNSYVLSLGYLVVLVTTIPMSYLNLDDNVWMQIGGMGLLLVTIAVWVANFCGVGFAAGTLPAIGSGGMQAYSAVLPTVLFNYGFVATTPSWLNEKSPKTSVMNTVLLSVLLSTALYLVLGYFGAASLSFASGADLLSVIADRGTDGIWEISRLCTYVFPIANSVTSIPVFSVIVRYNLMQTGWCPLWVANAVAVGLPWALSLVFYSGNQLAELINWSSALLFVQINLIAPLCLFLMSRRTAAIADVEKSTAGDPEAGAETAAGDAAVLGDATVPLLAVGGGAGVLVVASAPRVDLHAEDSARLPAAPSDAGSHAAGADELRAVAEGGALSADGSPDATPAVAAPPANAEDIRAVPRWWHVSVLSEAGTARALVWISIVLAIAAAALQIASEAGA